MESFTGEVKNVGAEVTRELTDERQRLHQSDDAHTDPDPELSADVGDELRNLIVGDLFSHHHVAVRHINIDANKVVNCRLPVGAACVVRVEFLLRTMLLWEKRRNKQ